MGRATNGYEFRHGDLYHVPSGRRTGATGDTLAIAAGEDGTVYKHGAEAGVRRWFDGQSARLRAEGDVLAEVAQGMTLLVFPVTTESIEALNDLIDGRGGVARFMERLSRLSPVPPRPF